MKKVVVASVGLALMVSGVQVAFAQSAAPSRAEVKSQAASANKAGQISSGEGPAYVPPITKQSEVPRSEVKKETAAANKAGTIPGTGVGDSANKPGTPSPKEAAATSDTTRADRKKTTAEANKAGEIKSGEGNLPAKQK